MMRFNHVELTFPRGTLTAETRAEIDAFYGSIFGWTGMDTQAAGQLGHLLQVDEFTNQFVLLAESDKPLSSPGYDHLGLLQETRADVDELLQKCKDYQVKDPRVQIKEYQDLNGPTIVVHAFYVKFLLPIWFDVQSLERAPGTAQKTWTYA